MLLGSNNTQALGKPESVKTFSKRRQLDFDKVK